MVVLHPRWLAGFSGLGLVPRIKMAAPLWGTVPLRGGLKTGRGTMLVFEVRDLIPGNPLVVDPPPKRACPRTGESGIPLSLLDLAIAVLLPTAVLGTHLGVVRP